MKRIKEKESEVQNLKNIAPIQEKENEERISQLLVKVELLTTQHLELEEKNNKLANERAVAIDNISELKERVELFQRRATSLELENNRREVIIGDLRKQLESKRGAGEGDQLLKISALKNEVERLKSIESKCRLIEIELEKRRASSENLEMLKEALQSAEKRSKRNEDRVQSFSALESAHATLQSQLEQQ